MSFCKKLTGNNVNLFVSRQNTFIESFRKIQIFMMRTNSNIHDEYILNMIYIQITHLISGDNFSVHRYQF